MRDCTLMQAWLTLLGRVGACGTADVYAHCTSIVGGRGQIYLVGLYGDWGSKVWEFDKK